MHVATAVRPQASLSPTTWHHANKPRSTNNLFMVTGSPARWFFVRSSVEVHDGWTAHALAIR